MVFETVPGHASAVIQLHVKVLAQEIDDWVLRMIDTGGPAWLKHLPPMVLSRDMGMATYGAALLWIATCLVMRRAEKGDVSPVASSPQALGREAA